jgi:hypothetical protein
MKPFITIFILCTVLFLSSCTKSSERPAPVNCNALITDTTGTGDTAKLFVPTAFSPNGDFLNEIFRPIGFFISAIDVKVYDENNNIVFSTQTLGEGWHPTVSSNIYRKYYYRVQAATNSNHKIGSCGNLYIVNCLPADANMFSFNFEDQLTQNGFTSPTLETPGDCN